MIGRAKVSRPNEALNPFRNIRRAGRQPRYITYANLSNTAAREERVSLVNEIFAMAQSDVPFMPQYRVVRYGWVSILNTMGGALLTMGDRQMTAKYHQDLLDMSAAPTAKIPALKESAKTFDEASEAFKILHGAEAEGVEATSFPYNALIGKLGKARRIGDCVQYFGEMRNLDIRPTSVTYAPSSTHSAASQMPNSRRNYLRRWKQEAMPTYNASGRRPASLYTSANLSAISTQSRPIFP